MFKKYSQMKLQIWSVAKFGSGLESIERFQSGRLAQLVRAPALQVATSSPFTLSLIFHSVTPIQGLCFRSAQNPFRLFDLHF